MPRLAILYLFLTLPPCSIAAVVGWAARRSRSTWLRWVLLAALLATHAVVASTVVWPLPVFPTETGLRFEPAPLFIVWLPPAAVGWYVFAARRPHPAVSAVIAAAVGTVGWAILWLSHT